MLSSGHRESGLPGRREWDCCWAWHPAQGGPQRSGLQGSTARRQGREREKVGVSQASVERALGSDMVHRLKRFGHQNTAAGAPAVWGGGPAAPLDMELMRWKYHTS